MGRMLELSHFLKKKEFHIQWNIQWNFDRAKYLSVQIIKKIPTDGIKISILLYLVLDPNFFQLQ